MEKFKAYSVEELSKELDLIYREAGSLEDSDDRIEIGQIIFDEENEVIVDVYLTHYKNVNMISTDVDDNVYMLEYGAAVAVAEDLFDDLYNIIYVEEEDPENN